MKTSDEFVTKDVEFGECTRSPECSIIEVGICESVNNPIICQSNTNGTEVSFRYVNVSRNLGKVKSFLFLFRLKFENNNTGYSGTLYLLSRNLSKRPLSQN